MFGARQIRAQGECMASLKGAVTANCPQGCGEFETEVWSLIRADQDPDLTDTIRGGELNLVQCPHCQALFYSPVPVIYLDPPVDLCAFIYPADAPREGVEEKLKADFAALKDGLLRELKMQAEPLVFFGMEAFKEFLEKEQFLRDESEIIDYAAREQELEVAPLKPAVSRELDWPYRVPVLKAGRTVENVLTGCDRVLENYAHLARLEKFRAALAQKPELVRELL